LHAQSPPTAPSATPRKRRRRSPELAEREILDAAEAFLRERAFRELTVDEVMARTTLSRPSFYVYFRDRHQLILRLVDRIGAELFAMADRWLEGHQDPRADARAAIEGVAAVYAEHGPVLRAIADASCYDPEVEAIYRALVQRFIDATAKRIGEDLAAGQIEPLDAPETARALVWMNERYLTESLGRPSPEPLATVVETLWTIWVRALYSPA
jgi:TetR/AcrR family transcriptional regulator, ethionamide resistance regulator